MRLWLPPLSLCRRALTEEAHDTTRWDEVADQAPEVVVFMPCGYHLKEAMAEGHGLLDVPTLASSAQIYAVDANAYFSRPGPRVIDGVEALAWVLDPQAVPKPPSGIIRALRR